MEKVENRVAHVAELREKAKELNLLGWENLFWSVQLDDLSARYNGCGPEWMGAGLRRRLTQQLSIYEPAFLIHDNEFHFSDGTRESFDAANDRLEHNCLTIANATYPYDGKLLPRLKAREEALLIGEACRHLAWAAWKQCAEKVPGAECRVPGAELSHQAPSTRHQAPITPLPARASAHQHTATSAAKIPKETSATGTAGNHSLTTND